MKSEELLDAIMHQDTKYLDEADAGASTAFASRKMIRLIPAMSAAAAGFAFLIGLGGFLLHSRDLTMQSSSADSIVLQQETTAVTVTQLTVTQPAAASAAAETGASGTAAATTALVSGTDAAAAAKTSAETTAALSGTESAETTAAEPETQRNPAGDFDLDGRLTQADILLASMMMSLETSGTDLSLLPLTEAQMQQADIIPDSVHQNGPLSEAERDALYQTVTLIRHCGFPELTIPDYLADQARYDAVCQQWLADRNAAWIKAGIEQIDWAAYGFSHTPTYEEFCDMTSLNMEEKLDGKGFLNIWNQLSDRKWETLSEEEQLDIKAECMRLRHIPDAEEGTVLPSNTMIQNYIFSLQHRDEPGAYEDYTGETEPPAWDAVCALIESAKG